MYKSEHSLTEVQTQRPVSPVPSEEPFLSHTSEQCSLAVLLSGLWLTTLSELKCITALKARAGLNEFMGCVCLKHGLFY